MSLRPHAQKKLYVEPLSSEVLHIIHDLADIDGIVQRENVTWPHEGPCDNTKPSHGLTINENGSVSDTRDGGGKQLGQHFVIRNASDLEAMEATIRGPCSHQVLIMEVISSWSIIPVENIIAAVNRGQGLAAQPSLLMVVSTAEEGRLMLEALEIGVDGIILRTGSKEEVKGIVRWIKTTAAASSKQSNLPLELVTVTKVQSLGSGDRACIDLSSLMVQGEGLLVGSFCRGLFLVHSECCENNFIASRPFRVNAGPVHSYAQKNIQGETAYLSELKSRSDIVIVDAKGRMRPAVVGRVKIESRPLILVEAVSSSGSLISIQLQNAETVQLVSGPGGERGGEVLTISVNELKVGDKVLALMNEGVARHTGISVKEFLREV